MSVSPWSEVAVFLRGRRPVATESVVWGEGTLPLHVSVCLGADLPPDPLITSARCLVFRGESILVLRNADGVQIIPGGRREPGESIESALRREMLEETGWHVGPPVPIGFLHLHHLARKQAGYPYPHPDFFQVVCRADAVRCEPRARVAGDYERYASFLPVSQATGLGLPLCQRTLLQAAQPLACRGRP